MGKKNGPCTILTWTLWAEEKWTTGLRMKASSKERTETIDLWTWAGTTTFVRNRVVLKRVIFPIHTHSEKDLIIMTSCRACMLQERVPGKVPWAHAWGDILICFVIVLLLFVTCPTESQFEVKRTIFTSLRYMVICPLRKLINPTHRDSYGSRHTLLK